MNARQQGQPDRFARLTAMGPTLILCAVGILLPNALSLISLAAGIGVPPRTAAIVAYAAVVLISRLVPFRATLALFLAVVAYDVISTVALTFGLAPQEIVTALHLLVALKPLASPLYLALGAGLALLLAANVFALRAFRSGMRRGNPVALAGAALVLAGVDVVANTSPHYEFGTLYAAGKPMESAAEDSGFRRGVTAGRDRHALLVLVEALGHFADPAHQALLLKPFDAPALRDRFDVSFGETTYYGSTTAAEMRELCGTRAPYQDVMDGEAFDCLPEQLARRGYRTLALHNFTEAFFDRREWYPGLGFQDGIFGEDLGPRFAARCGGPFRGPCDRDVVAVIAQELRQATTPTFAYWLTFSTHVPIAPGEGTPRLGCEADGGPIGHVEVCQMTELWLDVFEGIARMAAELPPTEILIVGDHAPPLWSRAGRGLFSPGKVSWIRLTPKSGRGGAPAGSARGLR